MAHIVNISFESRYQPRFKFSEEEEARYRLMIEDMRRRSSLQIPGSPLAGIRVDPSLAPRTPRLVSNHKKLHDFVPVRFGWGLSKRAIDLIESIEPGVHQHLPLDLRL